MAEHPPLPRQSPFSHPRGAGSLLTLATDAPGGVRVVASRSSRTLHLTARPAGSLTLASARARQQRRRLVPTEPGRHRRPPIPEHRSSLLTARRPHRPDPLTPVVPTLRACPLGDPPVDHHEPDCLFSQVVRRLDPRRRDEAEIALPMDRQPPRQVAAGARRWHVLCPQVQHLGPCRLQAALIRRHRVFLAAVNHPEHLRRAPHPPLPTRPLPPP